MLKTSASIVLASFRSSTGTRPPHSLGGAHRRGAPYSSHRAPQRVRLRASLAAALLDGLFEHPAREVAVRRELPKLLGIVSEEGWSGYRSKKDSEHYAATLVR